MHQSFVKVRSIKGVFVCVYHPTDKLGITDMTNGSIIFPPNIPNNAAAIHAYLTISDQLSVKTFLYFSPIF